MTSINDYRELIAWQKAISLTIELYRLTKGFPHEELYGLTSQIRRGAVSVPSNIAEGYGRGSTLDYVRFLKVARGCLFELDTQVLIAHRLEYIGADAHKNICELLRETIRVLAGLIRSLETKS